MRIAGYFLALFSVFALVGCGDNLVNVPKYDQMKNIPEAPAAIQNAAKAVVKIEVGETFFGTGSFLSRDGLLLTNNHVLGIDQAPCTLEGCYINLYRNQQIGTEPSDPITVFAMPVHVSAAADAAIYQVWTDESKYEKFSWDSALEISPLSSSDLQGQKVYVVGHPQGMLKKWTEGQVFDQTEDWIRTTNYSLHGNSGSPFLDEQGRIVGILHRGQDDPSVVSKHDVNYYSIGTSGEALARLLKEEAKSDQYFSVKTKHSAQEVAKHHLAYFVKHQFSAALEDGTAMEPIDALGKACDEALAKTAFKTPNELYEALGACSDSWTWLNCVNTTVDPYFKRCPTGEAAEKWRARYTAAAEKIRQFNGPDFLDWLVSPWRLETSSGASFAEESRLLKGYLDRYNPPLNLQLAYYLIDAADGDHPSYRGRDAVDYVLHYRDIPHYELQYSSILNTYRTLYRYRLLSREAYGQALNEMLQDEKIDVGNKLKGEYTAYNYGLL